MHIELLGVTATQPNTGAAGAAIGDNSLTVKNGRGVKILDLRSLHQVAGFVQIAFPSGHDTTRGYRADAALGVNSHLLPLGMDMTVQAQELLSITIAGSNTAGDVEQVYMTMHYDDLPGVSQRLLTPSQVDSRTELLTTLQATIASTAGPSYGTPELITSDSDLLRANRDYAVLGMIARTSVGAAYIIGPDTGNLRVGVPGIANRPDLTSQWFRILSNTSGRPCIPVINSGNKSSTFIGVSTDENAGNFNVSWLLALLK
jgi:hypothetical protein